MGEVWLSSYGGVGVSACSSRCLVWDARVRPPRLGRVTGTGCHRKSPFTRYSSVNFTLDETIVIYWLSPIDEQNTTKAIVNWWLLMRFTSGNWNMPLELVKAFDRLCTICRDFVQFLWKFSTLAYFRQLRLNFENLSNNGGEWWANLYSCVLG